MNTANVSYNDLYQLDDELPFLAYVKFIDERSRSFKPFELYVLLHERLSDVRMIQSYIYTKG